MRKTLLILLPALSLLPTRPVPLLNCLPDLCLARAQSSANTYPRAKTASISSSFPPSILSPLQ